MTDAYDHLNQDETQKAKLEAIGEAARLFAQVAIKLVPEGPDKTHALRTFRTAIFWMNYAISRAGKNSQAGD